LLPKKKGVMTEEEVGE